jgi:DNA replication protein DnaC
MNCKCGGKGFVIVDSKSVVCECTIEKNKERIWKKSGIPYVYWNLDIGMLDFRKRLKEDRDKNKITIDILNNYKTNFVKMLDSNIGLFIWGSHGNGKTLCACDIGKYISIQRKENGDMYKVFFCTFKGILNISWGGRSYDPLFSGIVEVDKQKELLFQLWNNADLRIIDDVGKEYKTGKGSESVVLDEFVRSNSYAEKKGLIITSNVSSQDLKREYNGNIDSLANDRIVHVEIAGEDFRKNKVKEIQEQLLKG